MKPRLCARCSTMINSKDPGCIVVPGKNRMIRYCSSVCFHKHHHSQHAFKQQTKRFMEIIKNLRAHLRMRGFGDS